MRALLLAAAVVVTACSSATASSESLRARVSPSPSSLTVRMWSPKITLTDAGKPASARLTLTIRKGSARRSFKPRVLRRGSYRARVSFPADGRWRWTLATPKRTLARGAISVSTRVAFQLPYDLALAPDGTIFFLDRSRVLALDPATRRVRVHAATSGSELVALERIADGTLFVTDLPSNRVLRIDPARRVSTVAQVRRLPISSPMPAGTTLWVASIATGIGVVRVDVGSGRVEPFSSPFQPHGIDRDPNGDFYVHDGHEVSRIDGDTGALTPFAAVDAFKLVVAPDGSVYGVEGSPAGGRVLRIAPDGSVTPLAGTGFLAAHRDGPALELGILPSAVQLSPTAPCSSRRSSPCPRSAGSTRRPAGSRRSCGVSSERGARRRT